MTHRAFSIVWSVRVSGGSANCGRESFESKFRVFSHKPHAFRPHILMLTDGGYETNIFKIVKTVVKRFLGLTVVPCEYSFR